MGRETMIRALRLMDVFWVVLIVVLLVAVWLF